MLQQGLHNVGMPLLCGKVKRVQSFVVVAISIAAGLEQQMHNFSIAVSRCLVKSSIAILQQFRKSNTYTDTRNLEA